VCQSESNAPKLIKNDALQCTKHRSSLVYQNATGVPNVTTVTNIPKMTKNDSDVPVFGAVHFYMGF